MLSIQSSYGGQMQDLAVRADPEKEFTSLPQFTQLISPSLSKITPFKHLHCWVILSQTKGFLHEHYPFLIELIPTEYIPSSQEIQPP